MRLDEWEGGQAWEGGRHGRMGDGTASRTLPWWILFSDTAGHARHETVTPANRLLWMLFVVTCCLVVWHLSLTWITAQTAVGSDIDKAGLRA